MTHEQMAEVQWLWLLNGENPAIFKWLKILMRENGLIDRREALWPCVYGPPSRFPSRTLDEVLADTTWSF